MGSGAFYQKENKQKGVYSLSPELEACWLNMPLVPQSGYGPGRPLLLTTIQEARIGLTFMQRFFLKDTKNE